MSTINRTSQARSPGVELSSRFSSLKLIWSSILSISPTKSSQISPVLPISTATTADQAVTISPSAVPFQSPNVSFQSLCQTFSTEWWSPDKNNLIESIPAYNPSVITALWKKPNIHIWCYMALWNHSSAMVFCTLPLRGFKLAICSMATGTLSLHISFFTKLKPSHLSYLNLKEIARLGDILTFRQGEVLLVILCQIPLNFLT